VVRNKIVVHCSDSPHGRGDNAETIHRWHQQRGFDGIGYHRVILEDGTVERGRPLYWDGAHVKGHNSTTIGICLIGVDWFTPEQLSALREQIDRLKYRFGSLEVVGHRDLDDKKLCPYFNVAEWYAGSGNELYDDARGEA
jgi:hypothetical protein